MLKNRVNLTLNRTGGLNKSPSLAPQILSSLTPHGVSFQILPVSAVDLAPVDLAPVDPVLTQPAAEQLAAADVLQAAAGAELSLVELGLGAFTPVGLIQNLLEFVHLELGLPWWGAIVAGEAPAGGAVANTVYTDGTRERWP